MPTQVVNPIVSELMLHRFYELHELKGSAKKGYKDKNSNSNYNRRKIVR